MNLINDTVLAGSSGINPSLMLLSPDRIGKPLVLSRFPAGHSIYALAFSRSFTRIAAGTRAGYLRVFDNLTTRPEENTEQLPIIFDVFHTPSITSLAFLTNDLLASGSVDGSIKFWSVSGNCQLAHIDAHKGGVFAIRSLGTLFLASIGADAVMKVWDIDTMKCQYQSLPFGLPDIAALISLDYDCQSGMLMHPASDGQIFLYDIRNDFYLKKVRAHTGQCIALSCSNEYIATGGCEDSIIKIFTGSLNELIAQKTLSKGILSLAWADDITLAAVTTDFKGHFFRLEKSQLLELGSFFNYDLRTVTGRNCELVYKDRVAGDQSWRDEKIKSASKLLTQKQLNSEFFDFLGELVKRGFRTEVLVLICAAASKSSQLLIRLKALMALSEVYEDTEESVEFYFILAATLEQLHEPQLAKVYLGKILSGSQGRDDIEGMALKIESSPFMRISPDDIIRGDINNEHKFAFELNKYTFLKKKFNWSVAFIAGKKSSVNHDIDTSPIIRNLISMADSDVMSKGSRSNDRKIFSDGQIKDSCCIYLYKFKSDVSIYFVLEVESNSQGFCFRPYGVIEFGSLDVNDSIDSDLFNKHVEDIWHKLNNGKIKQWFNNKSIGIHNYIRQSAGKVIVSKDDEF